MRGQDREAHYLSMRSHPRVGLADSEKQQGYRTEE